MLTLFHDYVSAASAVAVLRLQRLADEGHAVAFRGVEILPLDTSVPVTLDQHEERTRFAAEAAALGLRLRRPSRRPPTAPAHVVGTVAEAAGLGAAWRSAVYRAYWEHDADIGAAATLVALGGEAGLDVEEVQAAAEDRARVRALRRSLVTLRNRGVGAVPVLDLDGALVPGTLGDEDLRALARLGGTHRCG